jgi:hypothetical protein
MGRARGNAALMCAVLAAVGCNDESERADRREVSSPRAVAETFVATLSRGDAATACRQFLPRSAHVWFNGPCVPRPSLPPSFEDYFAHGEVQGVRASGAEAEVAVKTRESGVTGLILRKTAGGWKIFNLSEGSPAARQDRRAKRTLTVIGIKFSGYLDDHGNSFAGARMRDLRTYAEDVPLPPGTKVTSTPKSATISVPSQTGNVFRMRQKLRDGKIGVVQDCRVPGVAGCPGDGEW